MGAHSQAFFHHFGYIQDRINSLSSFFRGFSGSAMGQLLLATIPIIWSWLHFHLIRLVLTFFVFDSYLLLPSVFLTVMFLYVCVLLFLALVVYWLYVLLYINVCECCLLMAPLEDVWTHSVPICRHNYDCIWLQALAQLGGIAVSAIHAARVTAACLNLPSDDAYETV